MRFAVAALCVLALTGAAGAKDACAAYDQIPEQFRQTPIVEWSFYVLSPSDLHIRCPGVNVLACSYDTGDGTWRVLVSDELKDEERACVIQYEMAHMPPNFWGDPSVELPPTMKWLAEQKAAYLKGRTSPWWHHTEP